MCNLCVTLLGKFIEPDKKQRKNVNCKLCPKVLKYNGNTSNMRFHLESSHKAEFKVLQQSEKHKDTGNNIQQTVKDMLQQTTPSLRDSPRWNTLTQSVCYFVTKDMQPIDTINDKGFWAMIKKSSNHATLLQTEKHFQQNTCPKCTKPKRNVSAVF